jgi:hypothetical protein
MCISQTMYKTDFVCTYKTFEQIEDDEVDADMMYRAQFLQVFGLMDYDQDAINASLEYIKTKVVELPELKALVLQHPHHAKIKTYNECMEKSNADANADANAAANADANAAAAIDMLLVCLFAYPTMDAFHLCLIDAFKTGSILETNREKLLNAYSCMHA